MMPFFSLPLIGFCVLCTVSQGIHDVGAADLYARRAFFRI